MTSASRLAPTPRQLRYLRGLAARTGSTFSPPSTRAQASTEIDRLRLIGSAPREGWREHDREADHYATAVDPDEVSGYGSSATWRSAAPATPPAAGRRGEGRLAGYDISTGPRVLLGERHAGLVRVTDRPENGNGRSYRVEPGVELDGLDALLSDYIAQARLLDEVPMARTAVHELLPVGAHV
jgi:hypothetical protein